MLTKMALAALVGTVGVGAFATTASAEERGFDHGRSAHVERHYGNGGYGRFDEGRRFGGWEHARYDHIRARGYCR